MKHPTQTKTGVVPYWQAIHWCLKISMIALVVAVALTGMAIDAPYASDAETLEIVFASIWGSTSIVFSICGWVGQMESHTTYITQLRLAQQVRGLPQNGSVYRAVATGEYVEIWRGSRARADRYDDAWEVIKKFHAEEEASEAMEYWNDISRTTEGAVMVATPEAAALANTLDRK